MARFRYAHVSWRSRATIGNKIAPSRFLLFLGLLIVGVPICEQFAGALGARRMGAFDIAAIVFLLSCSPLLDIAKRA